MNQTLQRNCSEGVVFAAVELYTIVFLLDSSFTLNLYVNYMSIGHK